LSKDFLYEMERETKTLERLNHISSRREGKAGKRKKQRGFPFSEGKIERRGKIFCPLITWDGEGRR